MCVVHWVRSLYIFKNHSMAYSLLKTMGCTENPLAIDNHPTAFMFETIGTYKGSIMLHLLLMVLQMGY